MGISPEERSEVQPQEQKELSRLFGNWNPDGIEKIGLHPYWSVGEPKYENEVTKYELKAGNVGLEYSYDRDLHFLNWRAYIPEYLKSGTGMEGNIDFTKFILQEFPSLFYNLDDLSEFLNQEVDVDAVKTYAEGLSITIEPYRNSPEPRRLHSFRSESERTSFSTDYFGSRHLVKKLNLSHRPKFENDIGECHLYVTSPNLTKFSRMEIGLPLTADGIEGWTDRAVGWVLSSHRERESLDFEVAQENLLAVLSELSTQAYQESLDF